jgi:tetratricopeptide (TPR) repeat protein
VSAREVESFLDDAVKTRLFEASMGIDKVVAKHGLIIDALEAYAQENRFATRRIAQTLLEVAPQLEQDSLRRQALLAVLSEAAGHVEEAVGLAHATGLAFLQQHQLEQADRYLAMADRLCAKAEQGLSPRRCEIFLDLLELRDQRYLLGSERTAVALQNARILWGTVGHLSQPTSAKALELRLRAGYVLWRSEHTRENFTNAEGVGRSLMDLALAASDGSSEVIGAALSALGITLKALGRPVESRQAFAYAMQKASESRSLRIQCHSNEASLSLTDSPEDALAHYEAILEMTTANGPLFLPHLHAQVDRAMALFLMRDDEAALTQARFAEQIASSNGVAAQTARALNIIGCLLWQEEGAAAYRCFQQAVLDAERSNSDRFLWRMRTNLAAAAFDLGLVDEAMGNASSAARRILTARSDHWPHPDRLRTARWYHALVQCGAILWKMNRKENVLAWASEVKTGEFLEQVRILAAGGPTNHLEGFEGSLHSGRIMITG